MRKILLASLLSLSSIAFASTIDEKKAKVAKLFVKLEHVVKDHATIYKNIESIKKWTEKIEKKLADIAFIDTDFIAVSRAAKEFKSAITRYVGVLEDAQSSYYARVGLSKISSEFMQKIKYAWDQLKRTYQQER